MFCRKCGKELPEDSDFCQYCGTKVIIVSQESDGSNEKEDIQSDESVFSFSQCFLSHYYNAQLICEKRLYNQSYKEELLPALFVISDYAALSSDKNRETIADEILNAVVDRFTESFFVASFQSRVEMYGEAIRGKILRAEWLYGNNTALVKDAITRVGGLLGDILINPECINDYDNAPLASLNTQEIGFFSQMVVWPLISELKSLYKDIFDHNKDID